jgi:prepilin-type N-terminal cleavage/methylation domain-containing protein
MQASIRNIKKNKSGFTLVELIIVIVIISILAAIAIPAVSGYINNANKGKAQANARTTYMAVCVYVSDQKSTNPGYAESSDVTIQSISSNPGNPDSPAAAVLSYAGNVGGTWSATISKGGIVKKYDYNESGFPFYLNQQGAIVEGVTP